MEYNVSLQCRSGIVNMNDRLTAAFDGFEGTLDQFFSALCQNLYADIIRNHLAFDQLTQKIIFDLARCRESDFDFLKAELYKVIKHFYFFFYDHWIDQCLVTVPKVNATPDRCLCDLLVRPFSFRIINDRIFFITLII